MEKWISILTKKLKEFLLHRKGLFNNSTVYVDLQIQSSFYFDPFAPAEVEDEIKVLPNNKAYGLYPCPVSILKLSSHIISQPLAQIFNVSVSSGSFPAKFKTAKVDPVFKSGDESKP